MTAFVDAHRETLDRALAAIADRGYWSNYPESPSPRVYGEAAAADGLAAYEAHLGRRFDLNQPGTVGWVGAERSPYGPELGVTYPQADLDVLLAAAREAMPAWRDAGPELRAAVCVEIVDRINKRSFELANAVMHTSGQAFVMAFQAGGPHAQDRALEAIAVAYSEQTRVPATARWEKPQGKRPPLVMEKTFTVVPRGIGLVIGCSTFPTWNSYPGLFASLATGNAVVVKPHPAAILPLAITVSIARDVLAEAGFSPNLVTLVAENPGGTVASELAVRPEVRIVDFTGSTAFGQWLEEHARQAAVYTEKAGVNMVLVDSTDDYAGMLGEPGLLAVPLQRADVHDPAGPARPRRRGRDARGPQVGGRVRGRPRRGGGEAARPGRAGRRAARRDRQRRRAVACGRCRGARRRSSSRPGR